MQFIGSYHLLFSETDENNLFVIKCHANYQVTSTIVTKMFILIHLKNLINCANCWKLLEGCVFRNNGVYYNLPDRSSIRFLRNNSQTQE